MQISFASVSVPMYNSEMAPPQLRGRLSQLFQVVLTFAIFAAQVPTPALLAACQIYTVVTILKTTPFKNCCLKYFPAGLSRWKTIFKPYRRLIIYEVRI